MKKVLAILLAMVMVAMATLPVLAVEFRPSVEYKHETVAPIGTTTSGEQIQAVIKNADGSTYMNCTSTTEIKLIITPYVDKAQAKYDEIEENLDNAYTQMKETPKITELTEGMKESLTEFHEKFFEEKVYSPVNLESLVLADLFEASIEYNNVRIIKLPDGTDITFMINTEYSKNNVFYLLQNLGGDTWRVVDTIDIYNNGNVEITVDHLCAFAIVVEQNFNPSTGLNILGMTVSSQMILVIAGVFLLLALLFFILFQKKSRQDESAR